MNTDLARVNYARSASWAASLAGRIGEPELQGDSVAKRAANIEKHGGALGLGGALRTSMRPTDGGRDAESSVGSTAQSCLERRRGRIADGLRANAHKCTEDHPGADIAGDGSGGQVLWASLSVAQRRAASRGVAQCLRRSSPIANQRRASLFGCIS